jgi:UDP-N-acetylmuramoylalanine--D-glutamate ligase
MCTNNDAFARSLEAISEPKVVLAGGVHKGGDLKPVAEAILSNNVRALVVFGRSASLIEDAVRTAGFSQVERVETLQEAVALAVGRALPGDTVLLNPGCASFDQFRDFQDRGDTFKRCVEVINDKGS